jgi:polyisoprenoid-binding protein YceI
MRRLIAIGMMLGLAWSDDARASGLYQFDQRHGTVSFAVDHMGLFTSHGGFRRFTGTLRFDIARPEATQVEVDISAGSVEIASDEALTMLRSAEYFDVVRHADIRFRSTAVQPLSAAHFSLSGQLELRGVTRTQVLDVMLTGRHVDADGNDIADVVATGKLQRSAFGMLADRNFIDDMVQLRILMRVVLGPAPHGG